MTRDEKAAFNAGWNAAHSYAKFLDEHGNPPAWARSREFARKRYAKKKEQSK